MEHKGACCSHDLPSDYVPKHHTEFSEEYDHFLISPEPLCLGRACALVRSNSAGAISSFEGTTRDTFNGKNVVTLEYEAYETMARREWIKIVKEARSKFRILGTVMHHRVGTVDVGQTSVIIAVSSAHRIDSLNAVHFLIDSLKVKLPIWKKEKLDYGECFWKENEEVDLSVHKPTVS